MDMNSTQMGELAETLFCYEAQKNRLKVSRPITTERYDVLVDNGEKIFKVQIKSCYRDMNHCDAYKIKIENGKRERYKKGEIDILACYVSNADCWYIMSLEELGDRGHITVRVHNRKSKNFHLEENWQLLAPTREF